MVSFVYLVFVSRGVRLFIVYGNIVFVVLIIFELTL